GRARRGGRRRRLRAGRLGRAGLRQRLLRELPRAREAGRAAVGRNDPDLERGRRRRGGGRVPRDLERVPRPGDRDPEQGGRRMTFLPYAVAAWLFVIGLWGVVTSRHLVHLTVSMTVLQSSTYVVLLAVGYVSHGSAPV